MARFSTPTRRLALVSMGLLMAMAAGEVLTRLSIGTSAPWLLSDPTNYADPLCDDVHWALRHEAMQRSRADGYGFTRDTTLGWTTNPDHRNTLGAWQSPAVWSTEAPRVGLFGDSFVHGSTNDGQRLADHLQADLSEMQVLGYGVGGYGLDQIVLSMEAQLPDLQGAQAVIGIMLMDIDRTILQFRDGPKPWFSLKEGVLTLHTEHLSGDPRWPNGPASTFLAWVEHGVFRQIAAKFDRPRAECAVGEKTEIAEALVARAAAACRASKVECTVLMFPHIEAYGAAPGWRSTVIARATESAGLPLVDAGEVWADAGLNAAQVYRPDRHPGAEANAILALALAKRVSRPARSSSE